MTASPNDPPRRRMSFLTGATLFLVLVVYLDLRSPGPNGIIDYVVIGLGIVFVVIGLALQIRARRGGRPR